ncbi:MAG: CocE/NonD family hydrolase [Candidatus Binataceae bacterium]
MGSDELHEIVIERNLLIPLSDGATLSADLYRPAGKGPFPALLSFYPYHKDDFIGAMNEEPRRYFAARGYAHLLIDFRGLGGSSGVAWPAMDRGEGRDGAEAVEWIARQPWCDGNVGMWGLSYGGISSLKVGAENPPHLRAIVPIQGSADIYHDYLYPGGAPTCLGGYGAWGSFMLAMNLMPPTNADTEGRWHKVWMERLEKGEPYVLPWPDHPAHDEYWQAKAVDPAKIKVPTFIIGGWRDIFPEVMPSVFARLKCTKKLWMGPWMHTLPALSPYEPLDYLHEMKRWFDYWVRGDKNGIADEPPVLINVQRANIWKQEREWPIARAKNRALFLGSAGALGDAPAREEQGESYTANPTIGSAAGLWDPMGLGVGRPLDQGEDDLGSLTYTSEPLAENLEISGAPEATVFAEIKSGDDLHLVVKLSDVDPSGASALITSGWLRGACRNSADRLEPVRAGEVYEFRVALWSTSYQVPKGNRIRVSVSCSDFPHVWPTRTNPEIRVFFGGNRASTIALPVVPPSPTPLDAPKIRRPQPPPAGALQPIWKIERNLVTDEITVTTGEKNGFPLPQGGAIEVDHTAVARVAAARPDGANVAGDTKIRVRAPVIGEIEVATTSLISRSGMTLAGRITRDGTVVFEKRWSK